MFRNCENNNTISTYGELFLNNLEMYETLSFNEPVYATVGFSLLNKPFYGTDYLFYQ